MILVTGFGYRESTNASGILVKSLMDELPEALMPFRGALAFEVITCDETSRETEHQTLESQLSNLLKRYKPDLCIHTGQAPQPDQDSSGRAEARPEFMAPWRTSHTPVKPNVRRHTFRPTLPSRGHVIGSS